MTEAPWMKAARELLTDIDYDQQPLKVVLAAADLALALEVADTRARYEAKVLDWKHEHIELAEALAEFNGENPYEYC